MKFFSDIFGRFIALAVLFKCALGIGTTVTVNGLGTVVGKEETTSWTNRTMYAFRGIPYAQPPIGTLRFQPPVKVDTWNGTLSATDFGNICPQHPMNHAVLYGDNEDCLTLNVYVPQVDDAATPLPVMVYLHGGTFMSGYAALYQGHQIVEEDVILVMPQFRLGLLGLLSLQTDEIPGNVQFLDQIMAMQWVQDNIGAFGGDPSRVTIFGQSSGGAAANLHQLSPLSTGLFHRVIIMSGSANVRRSIDRNPVETAEDIGVFVGCTQKYMSELAACYKALPVKTILDGYQAYTEYIKMDISHNVPAMFFIDPTEQLIHVTYTCIYKSHSFEESWKIGGRNAVIQTAGTRRFLEEEPVTLLAEARYSHVPMMGGVTKHDGSLYMATLYTDLIKPKGLVQDTTFMQYNVTKVLMNSMGEEDITGAFEGTLEYAYYNEDDVGDFLAMAPGLVDISSVIRVKAPVYEMLKMNSRLNTTYLYTYNYFSKNETETNSSQEDLPFSTGVAHSNDLVNFFPGWGLSNDDLDMAKRMVKLWTSFARTGKPVADGVTWNPMSTHVGAYLILDNELREGKNFLSEYTISRRDGLSRVSSAVGLDSWPKLLIILVICLLRMLW